MYDQLLFVRFLGHSVEISDFEKKNQLINLVSSQITFLERNINKVAANNNAGSSDQLPKIRLEHHDRFEIINNAIVGIRKWHLIMKGSF